MRKTLMVLLLIVTLAVGTIGAVSAEPTTHIAHGQGCPCDNGQGHQSAHHHMHHHMHHNLHPNNHKGQ